MNTSILSVLILVILVGVNCGFRPRGSFHSDDGSWGQDNWMKWIRNSERRDRERGNRGEQPGELDEDELAPELFIPTIEPQPGELDEDELAPELFIPTIEPLPSTSEPDVNFNIKTGRLNLGWDNIFSQPEGFMQGKWPEFFRRIFSGPQKPWWKGPNVCVTREERNETVPGIVTHHRVFANSYCVETETSYKCTTDVTVYGIKRSFVVTYECCHGFEKPAGASGCTKKLVLKNLVETARDLDSDEFLRAVDSVGLTDTLKVENLTLFVPTNEAIKAYLEKDSLKLLPGVILVDGTLAEMASDLRAVLEGHVVPGFLKSSNFTDENLISTVLPPVKLRTNLYNVPRRLTAINCAKVVSSDHQATNGVIHKVDRVLKPATETVMDIVSKNPELSSLKTVLGSAGLVSTLKAPGQFTLFAPTNAAFAKLPPSAREKLMKGENCLKNVLKHHVLSNVICSGIMQGKIKTRNILDDFVNITRDVNGKVFVDGTAQVVATDIMGSNGVVHIIDAVIVPDSGLSVLDVLEKQGASQLKQLVESAGLAADLERLTNFTLFAPTDEAIQKLPRDVKENLQRDKSALRQLLRYHVVTPRLGCADLRGGQNVTTVDHTPEVPSTIQIGEYAAFPFGGAYTKTAQCAPIAKTDLSACNGVVHLLDQVMTPPKEDMFSFLQKDAQYSRLVQLITRAGLEDTLRRGQLTIFAPTNQALRYVDGDLLEDPEELKALIQRHVLPEVLCCAGIYKRSFFLRQQVETLGGSSLNLNRNRNGTPVVEDAYITSCDQSATNGVIHTIDRMLTKRSSGWLGKK